MNPAPTRPTSRPQQPRRMLPFGRIEAQQGFGKIQGLRVVRHQRIGSKAFVWYTYPYRFTVDLHIIFTYIIDPVMDLYFTVMESMYGISTYVKSINSSIHVGKYTILPWMVWDMKCILAVGQLLSRGFIQSLIFPAAKGRPAVPQRRLATSPRQQLGPSTRKEGRKGWSY